MKNEAFTTQHQIYFEDSRSLKQIGDGSIDLIVTSPPYPMIEMWDEIFSKMNIEISKAIKISDGKLAFELMHKELDKVWDECFRVLKQGGIMCINIGDATRTLNKNFQLFSSHSRILNHCLQKDFHNLPNILWRKTTNAPNKYMGSGMLPVGAYVTLEHEYILILRKGSKREFKSENDKDRRRQSAFFWEERNKWFSDIWFDLKGVSQNLNNTELRKRSAAYPFELAYRLTNMYSIMGDTILDPFLGTGTTILASIITGRNSVGYELENNFYEVIKKTLNNSVHLSKNINIERVVQHLRFIDEREQKTEVKSLNKNYDFGCVSQQESELKFFEVEKLKHIKNNHITAYYHPFSYDKGTILNLPKETYKKKKSSTAGSDKYNYELFID